MSRTAEDSALIAKGRRAPISNADLLVDEVKAGLAAARLDCQCRETVEQILDRVARARHTHQQQTGLQDARQKRDGIASLLRLLTEIDEITAAEADLGVFEEAAALFEDIAALAIVGADSVRRAGALPVRSGNGR
jgi:hypothetical protein